MALIFGPSHVLSQLAVFFSKLAVVTFGGAYAVLSYMAQQVVEGFGWLTPGEMLDALGLGRDHARPADPGDRVRGRARRRGGMAEAGRC